MRASSRHRLGEPGAALAQASEPVAKVSRARVFEWLLIGLGVRRKTRSSLVLASLALASLALIAAIAIPATVEACSPIFPTCHGWSTIELLQNAPIPADGVLVMRIEAPGLSESTLEALSATVQDASETIVDGALELSTNPLALLWRPAVALTPGMTYDLHIDVDNTVFEGNDCELPAGFVVDASFIVDDSALPEPFLPTITGAAELSVIEYFSFETIVCCNGAEPFIGSCSIDDWGGFCAETEGFGRIDATFSADLTAFAATGDQIGLRGFDLITGEDRASAKDKAPCVTPTAFVWATGEMLVGEEICAGKELVPETGPHELDPLAALQAECEDTPVNCAGSDGKWDSSQCEPWDGWTVAGESASGGSGGEEEEGEEEDGCGCRSKGGDLGGLSLVLLLSALIRRRG